LIFKKAADSAGLNGKRAGLSLTLVGAAKIKALNKRYRKKDEIADVLSFPMNAKVGKNDIIELGDVFICPAAAEKSARGQGVSIKRELALLAVHGFLHLLGHNHQTPAQEKKMSALQSKILATKG